MIKKIILLCFVIFSVFANAQQKNKKQTIAKKTEPKKGYTINISTENTDDTTIYLNVYGGNTKSSHTLDSAIINKLHPQAVFKRANNMINYPVSISTKEKENSVMLFLMNGIELNIELKGNKLIDISVNEELNKDFLIYQKEQNTTQKIALAQNILSKYPIQGVDVFFNFELVRLQSNDATNLGVTMKNIEKSIKFSDKTIAVVPNSYSFLNQYFKSSTNYFTALDSIFKTIDCENKNFKFYLTWILKNLEYKTSLAIDTEDNYQYILKNYLDTEKCKKSFSKEISDIEFKLKQNQTLALGKPLPNFSLKDSNGKIGDFNQYLNENKNITILIFYEPSCEHCITDVPKAVKQIDALEAELNVKLNKVSVMFLGAESQWQEFIKNSNLENWYNIASGDATKSISSVIPISGTPSYFVLDKNGNLISKNINEQLIRNETRK